MFNCSPSDSHGDSPARTCIATVGNTGTRVVSDLWMGRKAKHRMSKNAEVGVSRAFRARDLSQLEGGNSPPPPSSFFEDERGSRHSQHQRKVSMAHL